MHATQRAFAPFMIEHAPESRLGVLVTPSTPYETRKRAKGGAASKDAPCHILNEDSYSHIGRFRRKEESAEMRAVRSVASAWRRERARQWVSGAHRARRGTRGWVGQRAQRRDRNLVEGVREKARFREGQTRHLRRHGLELKTFAGPTRLDRARSQRLGSHAPPLANRGGRCSSGYSRVAGAVPSVSARRDTARILRVRPAFSRLK